MSEKVDANAVFFSYFHFPSYCPVRTDCWIIVFKTIDQTKTCLMSKLLQGAMKLQEQYIITIDAFSGFSTNNFLTTKQFTIKLP